MAGILETLIGKIVEKILEIVPSLMKRKPIGFVDSVKIDDIARSIVHDPYLSVDCFFVLIGHVNGGKKRKTTSDQYKYTSMMGGYFEEWILRRLKVSDFVYYQIDEDYRRMFDDIKSSGAVDYTDVGDPKVSKIRMNLQYLGLKRVRYFFLKENEEKGWIWYAVAGTVSPNENFESKEHKHKFDIAISQIKNVIKGH